MGGRRERNGCRSRSGRQQGRARLGTGTRAVPRLHLTEDARDYAIAALMFRVRRKTLGRKRQLRDLRQAQRPPTRRLAVAPAPNLVAAQQLVAGRVDAVDVRSDPPRLPLVVQLQETLLSDVLADHVLHALGTLEMSRAFQTRTNLQPGERNGAPLR